MNKKPLKVTILDKEYLITCEAEELDSLHTAINFLNTKRDIQNAFLEFEVEIKFNLIK